MNNGATDLTHQEKMLVEWEVVSHVLVQGHYDAAKRDSWWNHVMGVSVIAATTIAGSTVFANLGPSGANIRWDFFAGLIAILGTILASEQKYLRLEESATRHEAAARAHQALLQKIEILIAKRQDGIQIANDQIDAIEAAWEEIEKAAPTIPKSIYTRTNTAVRRCQKCPAVDRAVDALTSATA